MKKLLLLCILTFVLCFLQPLANAQDLAPQKELKVTLIGFLSHHEYQTTVNGIQKIAGVSNLVPSKMSSKEIKLTGLISVAESMFANDIKAFAMDKFQVNVKESGHDVEVTLKKL